MLIVGRLRPVSVVAALTWLSLIGEPALASQVRITVTNEQPNGGFSVSPFWFGIHDGSFDLFDPGSPANAQIESVAELADLGPLATQFVGHGQQASLTSIDSIPPFTPGESASTVLSISDPATLRYLSYAAMVVPSNDLFIANADPKGLALFDSAGQFLGSQTIQIFANSVWDAGTEVDDIFNGGAFVNGVDATGGADEAGLIHSVFGDPGSSDYLASFTGLTTAAGYTISHLITPGDLLATIRIESVPEPSSIILLGLGFFGVLPFVQNRRSNCKS
jgi:hypothetical protein